MFSIPALHQGLPTTVSDSRVVSVLPKAQIEMESKELPLNTTVAAYANSEEERGSVINADVPILDHKVIRRLRLKVDLIILPTLAITYTFK
jgi:2-phospho-L-lactate guanylyltransferase (CobY/MobA/RfbA family)